jgi:hypothetical protein
MRAASACADVGGIGFRNSQRRGSNRDGNRCELGLDLLKIKIKGEKALGTIVHSELGRITVGA